MNFGCNRVIAPGAETASILLKAFIYPCRLRDIILSFGRHEEQLYMIIGEVTRYVYSLYYSSIRNTYQPLLSTAELQRLADCLSNAAAPFQIYWGFINGTARPICRPSENQRAIYSGHKWVYALKFQGVVATNGFEENIVGPGKSRRHGSGMLRDSNLHAQL